MIDITKETWNKSGVEVIVLNGIKWLNRKNIEERLDYANLPVIKRKYRSDYRKHRNELVEEPKQIQKNNQRECFYVKISQ